MRKFERPSPTARFATLCATSVACVMSLAAVSAPGSATAAQKAKAPAVALVTSVRGSATVRMPGAAGPVTAVDFVQATRGEQYSLVEGAAVELVYFANGRRERWTGPGQFAVGDTDSVALRGAAAKVSFVPPNARKALQQVGLRKQVSRRSAVGGVRVRGLKDVGAGGGAEGDESFDVAAARQAVGRALPATADLPQAQPARASAQLLTLPAANLGPRARGDRVLDEAQPSPTAGHPAASREQARHDRFETLTSADDPDGVSVSLAIVRVPTGATSPADGAVAAASPGAAAVSVHVGDHLGFELTNLTAVPVFYAILELGPGNADGIVAPAPGIAATLAPFERRRLPNTFAAAAPLGLYHYRLVVTASATRWWEAAAAKPDGDGLSHEDSPAMLRALWHGPRPQAEHRWWTGELWGIAGLDLELRARPAAKVTAPQRPGQVDSRR